MRKTLIKSIGIVAFIVVFVIGIVIVKQYNTKDTTEQDDNSLINAFESTYCVSVDRDVFTNLLLQKDDFRVVTGYKTKEEKIWLTNDCIRAADTMIGATEQMEYTLNLQLKQHGKEQYKKMMQYLQQSPGDIYVLLDGVVIELINYSAELQTTAEQLDFYSYYISVDTKDMLYRTYFAIMTESMDYETE